MDPISLGIFLILWALGFILLGRIEFPASGPGPGAPQRTVSVIIPARNESANIGELLRSLQRQTYGASEIIVVDDHSTDETGEAARSGGATVIESGDLPTGWCGKPWACWQGARRAGGEILVFLDADTRLELQGLERLVATHAERGGLVSVQPYHLMEHPYEQLAAFFNLITLASLGVFGLFDAHRRPAGAFGPCNVCSRQDYFAVGGHSKASAAVVESLPLGQAFRSSGLDLRCLGGKGAVSFRMYHEGPRSLMEGFGKSFALGAKTLPLAIPVLITAWLCAGVEPIRHLVQETLGGSGIGLLVWSGCYLLFAGQLYWMLIRVGNFRWSTALAYPVPLGFFMHVFLRSLLSAFLFKRVSWKGRVINT